MDGPDLRLTHQTAALPDDAKRAEKVRAAIDLLLAGVPQDLPSSVGTDVPSGTKVVDVRLDPSDGAVQTMIELSPSFSTAPNLERAIAQVVMTASQFDLSGDVSVEASSETLGSGSRGSYRHRFPPLLVTEPATLLDRPLTVSSPFFLRGNGLEAYGPLRYELVDADGDVLARGTVPFSCPRRNCRYFFNEYISFEKRSPTDATLRAWLVNGPSGEQQVTIPVRIEP